jgi:porin
MKKIAAIASMALACLPCGPAFAQSVHAQGDNDEGAADEEGASEQAAQVEKNPATPPPPSFGITGDWGGARTNLHDAGVDLLLAYGTEAATNARGGARHDATMIGQAIVGVDADMDKLTGIKGGTAKVALFYRHGPSVNITADLGLLQQVQEAYGRGEIVRLVEAWYQQSFDDDRFRLKAGRIPANSDFASFSCDFHNLSFCASPQGNFPGGISYWFSAPGSNWAALARYNLGKSRKNGYFQVGAYQVNQKNIDPTNGFRLGLGGGTGVLIPVEAALTPNFGGKHPGTYKIGGWIETSKANDLVKDDQGNLIALSGRPGDPFRGRHGFYLQVLQQVTPSSEGIDKKGLSIFFNFTQLDRKSSLIDNQIAAGFTQTGTFKGRPNDQLAFALARTHVNSRMRTVDRIAMNEGTMLGVRDAEYLAELDYRIVPAAGVRISPNVQWGINPGAISENRNVLVFGVKSSVQF